MKIFFIIPAYNSAKTIKSVLNNIKRYYQDASVPPGGIVIDDGSTDNTHQFACSKNVQVLRHLVNRGQGASLQTGHEFALKSGADIIVDFDADDQHRIEDAQKMINVLQKEDLDIVIGSRFLEKSKVPTLKKWFILKPAIIFQNLMTGVKLTDAHNGLRVMTRTAAQKIYITQDRMAHATEIIEEISRNDLKFQEIPVMLIYNEFGQGIKGGIKILKDLFFKKLIS